MIYTYFLTLYSLLIFAISLSLIFIWKIRVFCSENLFQVPSIQLIIEKSFDKPSFPQTSRSMDILLGTRGEAIWRPVPSTLKTRTLYVRRKKNPIFDDSDLIKCFKHV